MWRYLIPLVACATAVSRPALAEPLVGSFELHRSNLATFDPATFGPGPNMDEYRVFLVNPNDADVTSIELTLLGDWLNNWAPGNLTFRSDPALPYTGPNDVAESFFVGNAALADNMIDGGGVLQAAWTLAGGGIIVPADSDDTIIAVVNVPTGTTIFPGLSFGRAAINGAFVDIVFPGPVPEPSTLVLGGCLSVALLAGRRPDACQTKGVTR